MCTSKDFHNLVGSYQFLGTDSRNSILITRPFLARRRAGARHETRYAYMHVCMIIM